MEKPLASLSNCPMPLKKANKSALSAMMNPNAMDQAVNLTYSDSKRVNKNIEQIVIAAIAIKKEMKKDLKSNSYFLFFSLDTPYIK